MKFIRYACDIEHLATWGSYYMDVKLWVSHIFSISDTVMQIWTGLYAWFQGKNPPVYVIQTSYTHYSGIVLLLAHS